MQPQSLSGFRELPHTADWELEVWAPDLATLFEQAARGMYQLCEAILVSHPRITRRIKLILIEPEILLIDFLTELIFLTESEGLAFDEFNLKFESNRFIADITGAKLESLSKEIKAVTYHNIKIRETGSELKANIVFDV